MSELMWEKQQQQTEYYLCYKSNKIESDSISSNNQFKILTSINTTLKYLYLIDVTEDDENIIEIACDRNIDILKHKAEQIYQIIKE